MTTKGELEESELRIERTREAIPCGTCDTTTYYLGDELVRQDQHVTVSPEEWAKVCGMGGSVMSDSPPTIH